MVREILKLGNPKLYEISKEITEEDAGDLPVWIADLHDTLMNYKKTYGAGRAIAAPQIGVQKRLVYMYVDKPCVIINPVLSFPDNEKYILVDDCMSFPGLNVKLERYRHMNMTYLDEYFNKQQLCFEGDYSELMQHECDHLEGILATMRAIDDKSLFMD